MKDSKRTFLQAGMDRDVDERLLPSGMYRYANNVRVRSSEGDDGGAAKTVRGNTKLTNLGYTNAVTIGRFADGTNRLMYWCVTSDDRDAVIEYNALTKQTSKVLESSRPGVLNFDKLHLITGINKIVNGDPSKDLLAFTDDFNPPRRFNIARAKGYGPKPGGFTEEDISVIKAMPKDPPEIALTYTASSLENNIEEKFLMFAYRYIYLDNETSAASSYSYPAFSPNKFKLDYQTLENVGMVNAFNAVDIKFKTGGKNVASIQLLVKSTNSNVQYIVETFNKKEQVWDDNVQKSFVFSNNKILLSLPENQLFRPFDNVPLLAKAQEFIGNRTVYANYLEGYDIVDANGNDIPLDYQLSLVSESLEGKLIPATALAGTGSTRKTYLNIDLFDTQLEKGNALFLYIDVDNDRDGSYSKSFTFIFNRDYVDASDLGSSDEFENFVENLITSHWVNNFEEVPPNNGSVTTNTSFNVVNTTASLIKLEAPEILYTIDNSPDPETTLRVKWEFTDETSVNLNKAGVNSSLKTNRSYEIGILYRDTQGRSTTTLTNADNTLYIPQSASTSKNKIQVRVNHVPPVWADRYQFVIKQNKGNYETIYGTIFYVDGLFRWVKLEGANKDKVKEGDTLIVKSDLSGPLPQIKKIRVLEVSIQEKNFIEANKDNGGEVDVNSGDGSEIIERQGTYMKIKPVGIDMSYNDSSIINVSPNQVAAGKLNQTPTVQLNILAGFFDDGAAAEQWKNDTGNDRLNKPAIAINSFNQFDNDGNFVAALPIVAGSQISMFFHVYEFGVGEQGRYERDFVVSSTYDNIKEWFETEVVDLGDQQDNFDITFEESGGQVRLLVQGNNTGSPARDKQSRLEIRMDAVLTEGIMIFETDPIEADTDIFYETSEIFYIENGVHLGNVQDQGGFGAAIVQLNVFNCFAMSNGAESYKIKDALNKPFLNFDLRPTTTSVEKYQAVRRLADLTWSGNYLEESSLNGLGEFNLSLANFKNDVDKKYGSIQKLHARNTDLVCFQEDKVHYILYGKNLLSNADGTGNLTSVPEVLGNHVAFTGEFGISKNPESMAVNAKVVYFTDAKRGAVLRLSVDGLTEISRYGMNSDFIELFKNSLYRKKVGGFDPYNSEYVLASEDEPIFEEISVLPCSGSYSRDGFVGEISFEMDFGSDIGGGSLSITKDSKQLEVFIEYDGTVTGRALGAATSANINFTKGKRSPQKATVSVRAPLEDTSFTIQGVCVIPQTLTVITVIVGDSEDVNKTILNRYRYADNDIISQYTNFETVFGTEQVATYSVRNGAQGSGNIPGTGSTVILESYKGFTHTAEFEEDDRIGYLVSDTLYGEEQYEALFTAANFTSVTETAYPSGDVLNQAKFVFQRPSLEKYLYLIYDYTLKNRPPVAVADSISLNKGASKTFDVKLNDTDPDFDPLTVIIVSQPTSGTVTINPDGTLTYTHNDSLVLEDSFNYRVTDGRSQSNIATVSLFIGVSCSEGINAGGSQGIYEATIVLGTDTGMAGITYDAANVPDRFQLEYDGRIVADSKYVGGYITGNPPGFTGLIGEHTLSVFQYDGSVFTDTGETRTITVGQSDIASGSAQEPTSGQGTLTFNKEFATPVSMKIIVTGPMGSTNWTMLGICPA